MKLPGSYRPLTTVVFGHEKTSDEVTATSDTLMEIQWATPIVKDYRLPFSMAFARISSRINGDWACGRSPSPRLAYAKATAEAKEWAACGCIPPDLVQARFIDLPKALDPRTIVKFHPTQYRLKGFPFQPFSEGATYLWAAGQDELEGSTKYVLADCVYFPYYPKSPWYAHANSSGVAAHPDREQAIRNGVLELVERESFMIVYLTKLALPTIPTRTVPEDIQKRIRALEKTGFRVQLKDYTLDLAPVVFIFAQSKKLAFTTCAGCSAFDTETALDHALMEVESAIFSRLTNGSPEPIEPSEVRLPHEHGKLYGQKRFFWKADFLIAGRDLTPFRVVGRKAARSWQELVNRFIGYSWTLVTVNLKLDERLGGNGSLHIVRSLVPGIIPISFGYLEEPLGMKRIYEVARRVGGISVSYRNPRCFPHPYT